jgi:hypothetical protein
MNIADRIAYDVECMRDYFTRLLSFAEASAENSPLQTADGSQFLPRGIVYLVRPDMACNVYSLVDFWLAELCLYHQRRGSLRMTLDEFKKKKMAKEKSSDLQRYEKYLTNIASLDLSAVQDSFDRINSLREVRNIFIHGGGHVSDKKRQAIAAIPEISIEMSLVVLTDQFVWQSLDHASQYLRAVAEA